MTREQETIRGLCEAEGFAGLGEIAVAEGLSVETTRKLVAYFGLIVDATARTAARYAADLVALERLSPGSTLDTDQKEH